jgi:hypothetical protein
MRYLLVLPMALALAVCGCDTYVQEADRPDVVVPDRTPDVDIDVDRAPIIVPDIDRTPDVDVTTKNLDVDINRTPNLDVNTRNLDVDVNRTP